MSQQRIKLPSGKRSRQGGYSYPVLDNSRDRLSVERYLFSIRESYIAELSNGNGEDTLTTGQLLLLDTLIMLKGINRCVEIEAAKTATIRPFDERYNARTNQVIRICQLLGIEPNKYDESQDFLDYVKEYDEKKAGKKAEAQKK